MQLTLPGNEMFSTFTSLILGPGGFSSTTALSVANSSGLRFNITVPSGAGYTAQLSGTSTDNMVTCTGTSSSFSVSAGSTTQVNIGLTCRVAGPDSGQITLVGASTLCASIQSIGANPGETTVGSTAALTATANGPDPASLNYTWSAPSGTFSPATGSSTTFTCTAAGLVTITLVVDDGPGPDGGLCTDTTTTTVQCDAVSDAGPG